MAKRSVVLRAIRARDVFSVRLKDYLPVVHHRAVMNGGPVVAAYAMELEGKRTVKVSMITL